MYNLLFFNILQASHGFWLEDHFAEAQQDRTFAKR
jgi:hypothetical protein